MATLDNFRRFEDIIMAPVYSPFTDDGMGIKASAVPLFAADLVKQGTMGVFVTGTNGESYSMTTAERKQLLKAWSDTAEVKSGKLRAIAHIGSQTLSESLDLCRYAVDECKYEAVAIMAPSFFRPQNEDQVVEWITAVAKAVPETPFFYYHFPLMTNVRCKVADVLTKANAICPNIIGAKFSDGDLVDFGNCISKGFNMLMGNDCLLVPALALGGGGGVVLMSIFNAEYPLSILKAMRVEKDIAKARKLQQRSRSFRDVIDKVGGARPVGKHMMKYLRGVDVGPLRIPNQTLSDEQKRTAEVAISGFLGKWQSKL